MKCIVITKVILIRHRTWNGAQFHLISSMSREKNRILHDRIPHLFLPYEVYHPKEAAYKDSFGKSENLSKTFLADILVFYPDYECRSSSSKGQL